MIHLLYVVAMVFVSGFWMLALLSVVKRLLAQTAHDAERMAHDADVLAANLGRASETCSSLVAENCALRNERDEAVEDLRPVTTQLADTSARVLALESEMHVRDQERAELHRLRVENPLLADAVKAAEAAKTVAERAYLRVLNATDAVLRDGVVTKEEARQIGSLVKEEFEKTIGPLLASAVNEQLAHEADIGRSYDLQLWRRCINDRVGKKLAAIGMKSPAGLIERIGSMTR